MSRYSERQLDKLPTRESIRPRGTVLKFRRPTR